MKGKKSNKGEKVTASPVRRPGVNHNYHDYANVSVSEINMLFPGAAVASLRQHNPLASGAQQQGFAVKLYHMLADIESSGEAEIVSWRPHGRCFVVHDRKAFVERVLPSYFLQSNFASFQRQLNLYGFKRLASATDKGGYYHELFLRGKPELACYIQRHKKKGDGPRKPDSPESEPDFYSMPFLPPHGAAAYSAPPVNQGHPGSCFQGQMVAFPHLSHGPQFYPQSNDAQVLSLRKLLPATMQPTAPPSLAQHSRPPPLVPYGYPQQGPGHPGQVQHAGAMGQSNAGVNQDFLQPPQIAPRPSDSYCNPWTHQMQPQGNPSAASSMQAQMSAPEYMPQNTHFFGNQDPQRMPAIASGESNAYSVPPPSAPKQAGSRGSASASSGSGTASSADYFGGRPMPPMPFVPTPDMLEQRGSSSAVVPGSETMAPLESSTSSNESCQRHSRQNSGTLSPASWTNVFGESEGIWTWLK